MTIWSQLAVATMSIAVIYFALPIMVYQVIKMGRLAYLIANEIFRKSLEERDTK